MDKEALEKVGSKEMKMKGLILCTISHELKRELMDLTTTKASTTNLPTIRTHKLTAKDMWELLKLKFEKKVGATPLLDFKRFSALNWSTTEPGKPSSPSSQVSVPLAH